MMWYPRHFMVCLLLLGTVVAAAEPASSARLDLVYGLSQRYGQQTNGVLPLRFFGLAPSRLRLSGAYFFPSAGVPLGVAVDGAFERFAITGKDLAGEPVTRLLTGLHVSGAAATRWSPLASLLAEGQVGYAYTRLPAVDTATLALRPFALTHHGPFVEAAVGYEPPGWVSGRLRARLMPLAIGGNATASSSFRASQFLVGAQVAVGSFRVAGLPFSGLLDYELAMAGVSQGDSSLSQTSHHFSVGVRLELPEPVERVAVDPPRGSDTPQGQKVLPEGGRPAPVVAKPQPAGPGKIRGVVVLNAPGGGKVPMPEVQVDAETTSARTGLDGKFVLEKVGPGPVPLKAVVKGYKPVEEVVAVPPGGEAVVELVLEKVATRGEMAVLKGQVRSTSGAPVAAVLRIPEAKLVTRAGANGHFLVRVPGGRYTVRFEAPGFVSQSKVVEVADGDQAIFYIDLSREER